MEQYFINLVNTLIVTLFVFSLYAMRQNITDIQFKMIFIDNKIRMVISLLIAVTGAYIITFIPEFSALAESLPVGVQIASATTLGVANAGFLIALLASDTGFRQLKNKLKGDL